MKKKIIISVSAVALIAILIFILAIITNSNSKSTNASDKIRMELTSDLKTDFRVFLDQGGKQMLREQLDVGEPFGGVWVYVLPYYTPTEQEIDAIVDAYWQKYLKNWTDYTVKRDGADSSSYSYLITYNWAKPNMDLLNQRLTERENALKSEYRGDSKRIYKTIVTELPTMIEELEVSEKEEDQAYFQLYDSDKDDESKGNIYWLDINYNNPFKPLLDPLGELKP